MSPLTRTTLRTLSPLALALFAVAAGTASTSHAQCPAPPTIIQGSDLNNFNYFGSSVAMDTTPVGTMLVTGSTFRSTPTVGRTGAVSSHLRVGNTWTETALLRPADLLPLDEFGIDVALDDPYLIVGASGVDLPASNSGAAYFFERSGTGWISRGRLFSLLAPAGSNLGRSVSITTANGGWAVAGAPQRPNGSIVEAGGAYLFQRQASGTWTHVSAIIDDNSSDGGHWQRLGNSVAIAGDVLVVGAPEGDAEYGSARITGYVKVFRYQAGSWVQSGPARWAPPRGGFFGTSVATDGTYIVVGAPRVSSTAAQTPMTGPDEDAGCAYVYKWNTTTLAWDLDGSLFPQTNTPTFDHGVRVAISGGKVYVSNTQSDRVYQYRRVAPGNWVQEIAYTNANVPSATTIFASDFAVAGSTLAIGDSYYSVPEQTCGAIFAFDIPAAAGNDACNGAKAVNAGTFTGCTTLATVDGASTCGQGSLGSGPDVWYSYTPSCSQNVIIDTIGSNYDTVLSIHSDCPDLSNTNTIVCNDDAPGGSFGQNSMVTLNVVGGTRYLVRIAGYNGASGSYTLRINEFLAAPSNNSCSTPVVVTSGGTYAAGTCAATTDGPTGGLCGPDMYKDVWYRFTPASSGTLTVDTCGSSFDTMLAVYPGSLCPGIATAELACNDDAAGAGPCGSSTRSFVSLPVTAGLPYMIRAGGYSYNYGDLILHVGLAVNCPADFNNSGTLTVQDIFDYLAAWFAGAPAADFNHTNGLSVQDIFDYLAAWFAGCP